MSLTNLSNWSRGKVITLVTVMSNADLIAMGRESVSDELTDGVIPLFINDLENPLILFGRSRIDIDITSQTSITPKRYDPTVPDVINSFGPIERWVFLEVFGEKPNNVESRLLYDALNTMNKNVVIISDDVEDYRRFLMKLSFHI
jgi:hypothetical protein